MGNVINSCPNNKVPLSSIKLNDPAKSCLNCSKIGYKLNTTSSACICSDGFYSNNNLCYPISCSSSGYMPNPNDNSIIQIVPLPYNIDFVIANNILTTTNNDTNYYVRSTAYSNVNNLVPFNNSLSINSLELSSFQSDGYSFRDSFNRKSGNPIYKIYNKDRTGFLYDKYYFENLSGEFLSISLPYKINLKKYKLTFVNNNFPLRFYILGTNLLTNDITSFDSSNTWYVLDYKEFSSIPTNNSNEYFITYKNVFNNTFSTIAIVIAQSFRSTVQINQFHLYGTYEDNSCICAPDYYLPSGSVITYDNGISGCVPIPYITFYDGSGKTQKILYDKTSDNFFYFYRTTSDTCGTSPAQNNLTSQSSLKTLTIIPTGFTTNFTVSKIVYGGMLLYSNWLEPTTCNFSGVHYIYFTKISDTNYKIDDNLSTNYYVLNNYQCVLKFLKDKIYY